MGATLLRTLNEDELLVYPNACRACLQLEQNHYQRWDVLNGWHAFLPPDDKLRLARMLKIREARLRDHLG